MDSNGIKPVSPVYPPYNNVKTPGCTADRSRRKDKKDVPSFACVFENAKKKNTDTDEEKKDPR